MNAESGLPDRFISERTSRTMLVVGAVFAAVVFLSTFVPRGVPVDRLSVGLLLFVALLGLLVLHLSPMEFRREPFLFLYGAISCVWVAGLILATGGPQSDFFPLFYIILIFGGAFIEKRWQLASLVVLVSLGYVSHYLTAGVMRDSLRDFLVVRVPVYFAAAFTSYYLIKEARRMREEKHVMEKLAEHLHIKAKQMEALFSIGKKVSSVLKVSYVLKTVASSAAISLNVPYVTIHLLDEEKSRLTLACAHGLSRKSEAVFRRLAVGEGVMGWVAMTAEPLDLLDAMKDYRFDYYRGDSKICSLLSVPMIVGARIVGTLTALSGEARVFSEDDVSFLGALASEAAVAAETARLHEKTEELSLVDALTGLYNVRKLKDELASELRRSERYNHPFSFAMLDIDHFKDYNDNLGHTKGDVVLQRVAELMKGQSRDVDICFRYGGEEFCIIFPETTKDEAYGVAERIRLAIGERYFEGEEKQPNKSLTISIGIATYPEDAVTEEGLINKADKAMYEAKKAGRNQVRLAAGERREAVK